MKTYTPTLALAVALLAGCMTRSDKINAVSIGMTKEQVLQVMGKPASVTNDGTCERLNYNLAETPTTIGLPGTPYEVKLVDGKVASFGRVGDAPAARRQPMILPMPAPR